MGLALVLVWDLLDRSRSVAAHYVDPGTVPVAMLPLVTQGGRYSLHVLLAGSAAAQWALLGLAAAAALCLLVGYRTRAAAAVSWYLLASLQVRNPLISWEGADNLLRILLLWSVLAPVGARFSLDARRRARAGAPETAHWLCTPATALLVLQVCAVYWITGMAKTGEVWLDGRALAFALRIDFFGSPLGAALRDQHALLAGLSHASRFLELLGPFLLFVPWRTWVFRLLAIAAFFGFHLGIGLLMSVGMFSPLSMVMWLPLVPSQAWEALGRARPRHGARAPATSRWVELPAAAFALYLVLGIAAATVAFATGRVVRAPAPIERAAYLLRVRQQWTMFSPSPARYDPWPILRGRQADGRMVDPFRGGPVLVDPPRSVGDSFPSFKWRLQFWWLADESAKSQEAHALWRPLLEHLCERWNAAHPPDERLARIDVTLRFERIEPPANEGPVTRWRLPGLACPRDPGPSPG